MPPGSCRRLRRLTKRAHGLTSSAPLHPGVLVVAQRFRNDLGLFVHLSAGHQAPVGRRVGEQVGAGQCRTTRLRLEPTCTPARHSPLPPSSSCCVIAQEKLRGYRTSKVDESGAGSHALRDSRWGEPSTSKGSGRYGLGPMTRHELHRQLRGLGLVRGDVVMVHASMRAVGPLEGGGDTLIAAIADTIGPTSTMLMVLDADPSEPFDALTTPVGVEDMGVLAELFRCTSGVEVNDHVAARFAARGPAAADLLSHSPVHHYFAEGSVLARFVTVGGRVLRLGADIDATTLTHHAEYLADVPQKRHVRRTLQRADVGAVTIESLDDTAGIADWAGGDYFSALMRDYLADGHARVGPASHAS